MKIIPPDDAKTIFITWIVTHSKSQMSRYSNSNKYLKYLTSEKLRGT